MDEATQLAEGEEVELVAVMEDGEDHLDEAGRTALPQANKDIEAGNLVDGDEVLAKFRVRYKR